LAERGRAPYSLLDVKEAAAACGLTLEARGCTLDEALSAGAPALLALQAPGHFLVALNQDQSSLQVVDGDAVKVVSRDALEARFRGVALVAISPALPGPRLVLTRAHEQADLVGLGESIVGIFPIRNDGDVPATVQVDSRPSCGVTAVLDTSEISPHGTGNLVVGVRVAGFGAFLPAVRVRTNDPSRRLLWFTVGGRTPPGLTVFPTSVELVCDNMPGGRATEAPVAITGSPETDVTDVQVQGVPATAEQTRQADQNGVRFWELTLRPSPSAGPGRYAGEVAVRTTVAGRPSSVHVPLTLLVRPNLVASCGMVFYGFVDQGTAPGATTIRLRTRSGEPFRILAVETTDPRVEARARLDGGTVRVSISTAAPGLISADVVVHTDVPLEDTLCLPVYADIRPGSRSPPAGTGVGATHSPGGR